MGDHDFAEGFETEARQRFQASVAAYRRQREQRAALRAQLAANRARGKAAQHARRLKQ